MKKIKNSKYLFQRKKASFTKKLFEEGLNTTAYILFAVKDFAEDFAENVLGNFPKNDPRFALMRAMFGPDSKKELRKNTIAVNLFRLKKEGLIAEGEKKKFYLTAEGKEMVVYIKDRYSILEKPWDKKLRLVVFDIPEKDKYLREWIRGELGLLLFKRLQKSVYIGKYSIPDDLYQDLIKNDIFQNVHIFTIDEADKQEELIKMLNE